MPRYRKKPIVIDAVLFDGKWQTVDAWLVSLGYDSWENAVGDAKNDGTAMWENTDGTITIPTLEGDHRCDVGDFIIRGVAGEFYPCKPDIFEATYELADGNADSTNEKQEREETHEAMRALQADSLYRAGESRDSGTHDV